ncbi:MAG: hypothetical protein ABIZ70_12500 [Gemmatimonadales bacterium]
MLSKVAPEMLYRSPRVQLAAPLCALMLAGCSGGPVLPDSTLPTGTLLITGTVPQVVNGLSTYSLTSGTLSPIASRVSALRNRLAPDGKTVFSFSRESTEEVYRLVSVRDPNSIIPLLEFPSPQGTIATVGLAVTSRQGEIQVGFLEGSSSTVPAQSTFRLHHVGTAGWTNTVSFAGGLAGLSWNPDGQRLVTTAYERNFGGAGRLAIVDIASQTVTTFGLRDSAPIGDAEFSPDGRAIVYSRLSEDGSMTELVSIGFEGGNPVALPPHLEGELPTFSPDGRYLAFCRNVLFGNDHRQGRFILRISDGHVEQILPPEQYPSLGCIHDWVK